LLKISEASLRYVTHFVVFPTFENLNNTNVRKIELSRNKLSEISKEAFVWFRNIQSLKIGWNPLTSSDLETAFYGLVGTPLTSLNIDNVTLDGHLPAILWWEIEICYIVCLNI
jgi:hypothetical protein